MRSLFVEHIPRSILVEIDAEWSAQNDKWGEQNHEDFIWAAILGEEFGEVQQAALHDRFGGKAAGTLREELTQTATVALQGLECIDRRNKK